MTDFERLPHAVPCHRCKAQQAADTPVALVASWGGTDLWACTGCVVDVEVVGR